MQKTFAFVMAEDFKMKTKSRTMEHVKLKQNTRRLGANVS
jgi:hypothetical protein